MQSEYVQAREKLATVVVSHVPVVRYDFRPKAIYIALMVRRIIQAMHDETVVDDKDYCMCCSVLQRVAACCSVLQCVARCCRVLQGGNARRMWHCTTKLLSTIKITVCVAACCSVLQRVAVCCSVLQGGNARRRMWHYTTKLLSTMETIVCVAVCCSVLQCVAVCCSVL